MEVVAPLLSLEKTALLAISTSAGSDSLYTRLTKLKDENGSPLFCTITFSLICDECRKGDDPTSCTHLTEVMLPPWLSSSKVDKIRAIMEADPAMYARETLGECMDSNDKVFRAAWIEALRASPPRAVGEVARHVFVAVDPAGGGLSNFAIVSGVRLGDGSTVLTGMDAISTKSIDEQEAVLIEHLRALRRDRRLFAAKIVLIIESNLGFEAERIHRSVRARGIPDVVAMTDDDKGRIGLHTDHARKELMAGALVDTLSTGRLSFYEGFVSRDAKKWTEELYEQLAAYSVVIEVPKNEYFGKVKKTYSGKAGGQNDDLCLALQFLVLYSPAFFRDVRYKPHW